MTFLAEMMQEKYGMPYIRVSYFGIEDMAKALYDVAEHFKADPQIMERAQELVATKSRPSTRDCRRYAGIWKANGPPSMSAGPSRPFP